MCVVLLQCMLLYEKASQNDFNETFYMREKQRRTSQWCFIIDETRQQKDVYTFSTAISFKNIKEMFKYYTTRKTA